MALIHVFNGFTEEKTTYTFSGKLRDHINLDWENALVLNGGFKVTGDYEVKPNDIIFIRKLPSSSVAVAVTVGVVALVAAGVGIGVSVYTNKQMQAAMEKAQAAAKAGTEITNRLPFVRGARNQAATGQTFPYIIGETHYTPLRLCPAHYTLAGARGEKQYYNVVLETGYNDILIKNIKMGDTVIKSFSETTPQNGVYNWDAGTYYDEENIIEIRQSDNFTNDNFNKKIVLTEINKEIPYEHLPANADAAEVQRITEEWQKGVVQQLASNPQEVEIIAIFDGLRKFNDDNWVSQTITLQPQWTNNPDDPTPTWHNFDTGFIQNGTISNTFTYNSRSQMRFSAKQTFTAAQAFNKKISIRVRRTTPKAEMNARDTVYLMAVQTTCYDAKKSSSSQLVTAKILEDREREQCCRIGIRVTANNNTDGMLDAFSVLAAAQAETWDGNEWGEKTSTRNLAAWVREIMISDKHAPSRYDPEELDAESWGAWYNYCNTMGFYADGVIIKGTPKNKIIETLCKNGNAALVHNPLTGKIEVAIDNGRNYSVALLNSDTIQSISTTKEFKRKTTGKKVTYINRAADFDIDSVIFMRDGGEYDPANDTLTTTALEYITDYAHAFKYAWRQMAEEIAQPRVVTVKVGPEAAYYPLFSRVELQHKSLKIGIAHAQIKALKWYGGLLKEITLTGPVTFPAGFACGIIVNCVSDSGRGLLAIKVTGTGTTDTLEVLTNIRTSDSLKPTTGNFCSFGKLDNDGEFSTVTKSMKIINAEETENGYTLTLVDYNPEIYEYGTLPEYKTNITSIPEGTGQTVENQREYIQSDELQAAATEAAGSAVGNAVQAAVDTITGGHRFTNIYNVRPVTETLEEIIARLDDDARKTNASISISEEEILLQVSDMERELVGLIDVQAGSVTALVEGGGAVGYMNLSLNLPVTISEETRAKMIEASTEEKVNAVYGKIENTNNYAIKGNADSVVIIDLWNDAIKAQLIASQIDLTASHIKIGGENVYIEGESFITNAKKIKAKFIEVEDILGENAEFKGTLYSKNGVIENMQILGNSIFMGEIVSGPLELLNIAPSGETIHFNAGTNILNLELYNSYNYIGHYGTIEFDRVAFSISGGYTPAYSYQQIIGYDTTVRPPRPIYQTVYVEESCQYKTTMELYDAGVKVYSNEKLTTKTKSIHTPYYNADYAVDIQFSPDTDSKIFKLKNLPTVPPAEPNIVWNDNGTLKIS